MPPLDPYSAEAEALSRKGAEERAAAERTRTVETLRLLASCLDTLADAVEEDDHILGPMASTGVANHLADLPRELRELFAECVSEEAVRGARADRWYWERPIPKVDAQGVAASGEDRGSKAEAYRRQAEAASKAIESSPGWLRNTAVPPSNPAKERDA